MTRKQWMKELHRPYRFTADGTEPQENARAGRAWTRKFTAQGVPRNDKPYEMRRYADALGIGLGEAQMRVAEQRALTQT